MLLWFCAVLCLLWHSFNGGDDGVDNGDNGDDRVDDGDGRVDVGDGGGGGVDVGDDALQRPGWHHCPELLAQMLGAALIA